MGTFHQNKHSLHGITVVVETDGDEVYVGRCDDMDDAKVILLDVAIHRDGDDDRSNDEFVRRAAALGHWPQHRHLVLDAARVKTVRRLGDIDT